MLFASHASARPRHRRRVSSPARPASATGASRRSRPTATRRPATGREIERAAALERRPPELERVGASDLSAVRPARPRDHRRHPPAVLQPQHHLVHRPRPVGLRCRGAGLPVAGAQGRLRLEDPGRQGLRPPAPDHRGQGLPLQRRGPHVDDELPVVGRSTRPRRRTRQPVLNSMEAGIVVVYQKCPHLGCRVPSCGTSQWFECPCHGSQYNQAGEKKGGPAPRGMDRFVDRGRPTACSTSTPAPSSRARRSGPTPPARRPRVRTVWVEAVTDARARQPGRARHGRLRHRRRHRRRADRRLLHRRRRQHAQGPGRGRCRARARRQPQALPERRGARGHEARPHAGLRPGAAGRHRRRPARSTGWPSPAVSPAPSRSSRTSSISRGENIYNDQGQVLRLPRPRRRRRRQGLHAAQRQRRLRGPGRTGRRRRSTPCCSGTRRTR